jgi:hypothetical protein
MRKGVVPTNDVETTGYSHAKEKLNLIPGHTQKLTQNATAT